MLAKVVTLSPGPLSKQDLQDVQTMHIQREAQVWVALGRFSSFQWVWWLHAKKQLTQALSVANMLRSLTNAPGKAKRACWQGCPVPSAALATSVRGEELALSSSFVLDGALLEQLALLAGLVCMLLLFALLPLPWPLPTPAPTPFCLYGLSFHSLERLAGAPVR